MTPDMRSLSTRTCMLAVTAVTLAGALRAQESKPASQPAPRDLAPILKPIRAKYDAPALCAAIVWAGRVTAIGCDGVRRRGSSEVGTINDRFHLGSDTKSMTATLAALFVEEGKLKWTTTLGEVFADKTAKADARWSGVTLEQLLTHTAGVPSDLSRDGLWDGLCKHTGSPKEIG